MYANTGRRVPAERGRAGYVVAVVGCDGAGKSTVATAVAERLGSRGRYRYGGVNLEAGGMPLLRLLRSLQRVARRGGPDRSPATEPSSAPVAVPAASSDPDRSSGGSLGYTAALISDEWWFLLRNAADVTRGRVVVNDRSHLADYLFHDVHPEGPRPWHRRLHGWLLARYPRPALIVLLDLDVATLAHRRPEERPDDLRRRRDEYRRALPLLGAPTLVVHAGRPLDEVVDTVVDAVLEAGAAHGRGAGDDVRAVAS